MDENKKILELLTIKLNKLAVKHASFSEEIEALRAEIRKLKNLDSPGLEVEERIVPKEVPTVETPIKKEFEIEEVKQVQQEKRAEPILAEEQTVLTSNAENGSIPALKENFEKFIGENLINKVGIIILIIGVAIGAKYSIDNNLISPLTRIILGYATSIVLLVFGIKLKQKYESFSAVLVSGAIAIMYFITFAAYNFYNLIPQEIAFVLMVIFTAFTVFAAINYNLQVIALIGLVGAYGVPFLLSEGSGQIGVLFAYMSIINIGILVIAFKKYWKNLFHLSFSLSWFIYVSWFFIDYIEDIHFQFALLFLSIFFITFQLTFLAYKLIKKELFEKGDVLLLSINTFIFYSIGFAILMEHSQGQELLGLFTLLNAVIYFIIARVIYRQKEADKNLFYFMIGLVFLFITLAIPVQLEGNWITLFWSIEAVILFWIGRTKGIPIYERLSYPLILLAFGSAFSDWAESPPYNRYDEEASTFLPVFNIHFLVSIIVVSCFTFIAYLNENKAYKAPNNRSFISVDKLYFLLPTIAALSIYLVFFFEISYYWDNMFYETKLKNLLGDSYNYTYNYDLELFRDIWLVNYTALFLSIMVFINIKFIRRSTLTVANLILMSLCILVFLALNLPMLDTLQWNYMNRHTNENYDIGSMYVSIRYISIACIGVLLWSAYQYFRAGLLPKSRKPIYDCVFHITLLVMLTSELIYWMNFMDSEQPYSLGVSILWGLYALLLIGLGIWKKKKHLRIMAINLFGLTLVKLFIYDIVDLDTISKTIVFVSLGVLLLIISFLYNKYKHIITDEAGD